MHFWVSAFGHLCGTPLACVIMLFGDLLAQVEANAGACSTAYHYVCLIEK
jgi:hypothetical protein